MSEITYADVFSGVGGFRRALQNIGGFRCVWSCDNNKYANQIYTKHFGEENHHSGDIRRVDAEEIPDFDLLCAGFPCQAFSVAGKRKGFKDTHGTLFFEILRITEAKRPAFLLLENVKGLLSHDGGRTFTVILQSLDELGYWVEWQVLNSKHFGVPQNRGRVFIVGHSRNSGGREVFPITEDEGYFGEGIREASNEQTASSITVGYGKQNMRGSYIIDIKRDVDGRPRFYRNNSPSLSSTDYKEPLNVAVKNVEDKYLETEDESLCLDSNYWKGPDKRGQRTLIMEGLIGVNNQANRIYSTKGISPTLPTPRGGRHIPNIVNTVDKDGYLREMGRHEIGKHGLTDYRIRRLTPIECERLQGFPDKWTEGISDTQRYKCLGNAVTVNVIEFLGRLIRSSLRRTGKK